MKLRLAEGFAFLSKSLYLSLSVGMKDTKSFEDKTGQDKIKKQ